MSNFDNVQCQNNGNFFNGKLKKLVSVVLYGPATSQSDCKKTDPYQLPYNKLSYQPVFTRR